MTPQVNHPTVLNRQAASSQLLFNFIVCVCSPPPHCFSVGIFSALPIESARRTAATAGAAAEKDGGGSSTGSSDDTCSASSDATYDLAALSHADSAVHTAVHARARAPVAASPPPSVAAQQKQRGDGDRDSSNKYLEVVHSLRRMLAPGSPPASSALSSASASAGHLHLQHTHQQQHRFPTAGGGSATGTVLVPSFQYDCIKHVTFRHAKLGLSLVRVSAYIPGN